MPPVSPDYQEIVRSAIATYQPYLAAHPSARAEQTRSEPRSPQGLPALNFDVPTPKEEDKYLEGNFVEGTWVSKLESEVDGEEGLYNVAVDPGLRTPYALLLPTKDYHEQSAPLRPAYLVHAHRLLVALETALSHENEQAETKRTVLAVYDCGEKSGVRIGHKCIRFYTMNGAASVPPIAHRTHALPELVVVQAGPAPDPRLKAFTRLLNGEEGVAKPFIPRMPHYNLIMTRETLTIVPRDDDGFLHREEGRWDGARLSGVPL
ncbi:hypothetical protein DB88DRAFT_485546 [Papiliotrema laurentii]|uniref:Uncharacterized protein n=1 Tax=Papiliotrema laurentii TaxID=5418 RepID=A0AAD9FTA2_PAPLA|nr:hypothetical protein DB88DRAFT_485546 [Papiliotrema laurentii]